MKNLLILVFGMLFGLLLISCDKDKEMIDHYKKQQRDEKLYGRWMSDNQEDYQRQGALVGMEFMRNGEMYFVYMTKSQDTGIIRPENQEDAHWFYNQEDILYILYASGGWKMGPKEFQYKYSIEGDKLTMIPGVGQYKDKEYLDSEKYEFIKVKNQ